MFLNMLNEREGKNFLELATLAMQVDGEIAESEKAIIESFRMELRMPDYKVQSKPLEDLVSAFQGSTKRVKRAVIVELAGVMDADDVVKDVERNWLLKLGSDWGFRDTEMRKMLRWVQDFNDLLQEGYDYINK